MGVGNAGSFHHLGLGGLGVEADVVENRVVEQNALLGHDAHLVAHRVQGAAAQVVAIDENLAAAGIVEARQQVGQGAFSAAAAAHQGHGLTFFDGQVDVVQHGRFAVAEAQVMKLNFVLESRQHRGVGQVADGWFSVDDAQHPLASHQPALNVAERRRQRLSRREHLRKQNDVANKSLAVQI